LRYHPDDPADLRAEQDAQLLRLFDATRGTGHELLLEIIAAPYGPVAHDTVARVMAHVYALGIYPDWWKLEATDDPAAWAAIEAVIADADPWCRGVVVLGAESSPAHLARSFAAAAPRRIVKGFAVGRAIWHDVAQQWFTGMIDDETALVRLTANFAQMVATWRGAQPRAGAMRLTAAQALVRWLAAQDVLVPGAEGDARVPFFGGVWAIFGHGNVAALGRALAAADPARLPTYRAHSEQGMAHAAIGYARAHARRRAMACTTSIGPGQPTW
jgi:hypothetical protein